MRIWCPLSVDVKEFKALRRERRSSSWSVLQEMARVRLLRTRMGSVLHFMVLDIDIPPGGVGNEQLIV